jgi:predicted nucleic acid-binding protein
VAAIVIADASPLIALARVNGLVLFQATAVDTSEPALPDLDEGEAASIRLALSRREPVLLLIDERAGRAVAQELGITVAGTAAVIGMAHQRGLISSARDVFAALHASDFRIAPAVIQAVLDRRGNAAPIDGDEPPTAQSG